ncbi:MAG: UDP-4-amino-4,6-dideoxy-N-acetyl-beta-L-altrosamine N-acetyltransferase [Candidatus Eremiobacteraeota bacterium]|nr:UDP-4-amino-4,6-dideoxy-N-acetyl-beta-L-altrosamine N-acetyltransferase [Candidatus Eremiobacteraeota bacterium]
MIELQTNFDINSTEIINFLNLSGEEREMVLSWRNHYNVRMWMYSDNKISLNEHINFIDRLAGDTNNFYWIVKNKDGISLGTIYLNKIDFKNKHAYIGIYSNPYNEFKTKGTLLIQCIKKLAFKVAELHTLKLEVIENNKKAINFYKKSGFNEEGRLKEFVFKDRKWHDVIIMGITNDL